MRVLSAAGLVGLVSMAACGSAPVALPPAAPPAPIEVSAIAASEPAAPPDPEEVARRDIMSSVEDLRIPNERSCMLRAPTFQHAVLRLKPDGLDFARVPKMTDARVHVTADPVGTGLFVELVTGPVTLTGITPADDMAIYAKQPVTLGGIFLPEGDTRLRIAGASKGHVLLEVARTPFDLRELTTMLRNDVSCDAASLLATRLNARASLGKAIGTGHLLGDAVPLSLTANGEPVATLVPGPPAAEILERAEGATRIAWRVDGGYVSGWVPASQLGAKPKRGEGGSGHLDARRATGEGSTDDRRACERDVPLGVAVGGEARFVGRIRARALIAVRAPFGGKEWVSVGIPGADIATLNSAHFFVRSADVEDCARLPPTSRQQQPRYRGSFLKY